MSALWPASRDDHDARPIPPMLSVRGIARRYDGGQNPAVNGVSFDVGPGEVVALLGPSGCGKSTTLRLLAGFERPDAGEVWVEDRCVATARTPINGQAPQWTPPERRQLGMVFQDYALFPHLTVAENVAFGLHASDPNSRSARVESLIATVGLRELAHRYPHQLSGGQQQRVALARALAPRPRAILLDEPFNTLDVGMRSQVRRDLFDILAREQVAVVLVTHDQDEAFAVATRIVVMRRGRVEQIGSPAVLYNRPANRFVAGYVGDALFLPVEVHAGRVTFPTDWPVPSVTISDPAAWVQSGEVVLLVRPEEVTIEPDPDGASIAGEGRLRGPDVEYDVRPRVAPFGNLVLRTRHHTWLAPGTPVRITLNLSHVVLFAGDRTVASLCLTGACTCP